MGCPNPTVALAACKEILDRGFGKAAQAHTREGRVGSYDLSKLSDDQLQSLYGTLRLASAGVGDTD
jgi:hypothetical protein